MQLDMTAVLVDIDAVLGQAEAAKHASEHDDMSDLKGDGLSELVVLISQTITRFAPPGSEFKLRADGLFAAHPRPHDYFQIVRPLIGILKALRTSYEMGYLRTIQELVHADVFADFLAMADYLVEGGYKDSAAVTAGGVLEEHLRKLCNRHGIPTRDATRDDAPRKSTALNDDLAKVPAYSKMEQDAVKGWLKLRNHAAHGDYTAYDEAQVRLLIQGLRDFLSRHPA